jgi:predicted AAA+ superfamily ATPase
MDVDVDSLMLTQRETLGNLVENFVYSELLKHSTYAKKTTKIYHYRDGEYEVDLVLEQKNGNIIAIEVKSGTNIQKEHLKGLVKLAKNAKNCFVKGYIFYGGDKLLPISRDGYNFWLIPLSVLF